MTSKIIRETWIDAPREEVWDKGLKDFANIYEWNPAIAKSFTINETAGEGLGAERQCNFEGSNLYIEERVLRWEEGHSMDVLIADGKGMPPWRNPVATLELFDENGGTRMRMTMAYEMKLGPIGKLMDKYMIKPRFGKNISGVPGGLKAFIETGKKVSLDEVDFSQVREIPA